MDHRDLKGNLSSDMFLAEHEICPTRRALVLAPLLAALPLALSDTAALAGRLNPSETQFLDGRTHDEFPIPREAERSAA
jgi:hypothetical protein